MANLRLIIAATTFGVCLLPGWAGAAPIGPEYATLYNAVYTACIVPDGDVTRCDEAINAYADRAVQDDVSVDKANESFTALRKEVFETNGQNPADEEFQIEIDNLFELLLPKSGAINPLFASDTI